MNIAEIIQDWPRNHPEYDGLANPDLECGCRLDDLMPCDMPDIRYCKAGHSANGGIVVGPKARESI